MLDESRSRKILCENVDLPGTLTRLYLGVLGGLPCCWKKPYIPSRDLKNSSFFYCVLVQLVLIVSAYEVVPVAKKQMQEAYPYDLFMYILSVQQLASMVIISIPFILWLDVEPLVASMEAWSELMESYERILRMPIPSRREKEKFIQCMIAMTGSSFTISWYFAMPHPHLSWRPFFSYIMYNCILLSGFHLWIGYCLTLTLVSKSVSVHVKECSENNLLTPKRLQDFRKLWILMRRVLDKLNDFNGPLRVLIMQFFLAVVIEYSGLLLYAHTGRLKILIVHLAAFITIGAPSFTLFSKNHAAAYQVEILFEEVFSHLKMTSFSSEAQREICMIYFVKGQRKPKATLNGFQEVSLSLAITGASAVALHIIVLVQFHQMNISSD